MRFPGRSEKESNRGVRRLRTGNAPAARVYTARTGLGLIAQQQGQDALLSAAHGDAREASDAQGQELPKLDAPQELDAVRGTAAAPQEQQRPHPPQEQQPEAACVPQEDKPVPPQAEAAAQLQQIISIPPNDGFIRGVILLCRAQMLVPYYIQARRLLTPRFFTRAGLRRDRHAPYNAFTPGKAASTASCVRWAATCASVSVLLPPARTHPQTA